MIVHQREHGHLLIAQPEHARQSSVIVAHLRPEFLGDMTQQREILDTARHHDDGWFEWESDPEFQENGLPVNFMELEQETHVKTWQKNVQKSLERYGPQAAVISARHADVFLRKYNDDVAKAHKLWINQLLEQAWPNLPEETRWFRMEQSFSALFVGDALSLIGIADWKDPMPLRLYHSDGSAFEMQAWSQGDLTVCVDPWPFALPRLEKIHFDAWKVEMGNEQNSAQIIKNKSDQLRFDVTYQQAGGKKS